MPTFNSAERVPIYRCLSILLSSFLTYNYPMDSAGWHARRRAAQEEVTVPQKLLCAYLPHCSSYSFRRLPRPHLEVPMVNTALSRRSNRWRIHLSEAGRCPRQDNRLRVQLRLSTTETGVFRFPCLPHIRANTSGKLGIRLFHPWFNLPQGLFRLPLKFRAHRWTRIQLRSSAQSSVPRISISGR